MRKDTRADHIARILSERIIFGEIAPGAALRQDRVAREFDASHVPVREAFRRLEAQGLVESLPRRGVRVTEFDVDELREVAEMRASLEVLALRHAAPNMTSEILWQAEEMTRRGERAESLQEWEEANRRFHRVILEPCAMPRLLRTIDDLQLASARFLFAAWRKTWERRTDHDHRAIIEALRKRQTDLACSILARHVGWIGRRNPATKNADEKSTYEISG